MYTDKIYRYRSEQSDKEDQSITEIMTSFRSSLKEDRRDIELEGYENGIVKVRKTRTAVPVTFIRFLRDIK